MWWPQRALFGCAALKSAHASSRQTVPAEVAENKSKSDLAVVFLDRIAVDTSKERARRVRLDGDHLVGRGALETFGLVHEHNFGMFWKDNTLLRIW